MKTMEIYADTRGPGVCRGCHAPIEWATVVKSGKKMCFTGEIVALSTRHNDDRRLIEAVDFDTNHWAACPARDQFRSGR
jgi:hypothetical protein